MHVVIDPVTRTTGCCRFFPVNVYPLEVSRTIAGDRAHGIVVRYAGPAYAAYHARVRIIHAISAYAIPRADKGLAHVRYALGRTPRHAQFFSLFFIVL